MEAFAAPRYVGGSNPSQSFDMGSCSSFKLICKPVPEFYGFQFIIGENVSVGEFEKFVLTNMDCKLSLTSNGNVVFTEFTESNSHSSAVLFLHGLLAKTNSGRLHKLTGKSSLLALGGIARQAADLSISTNHVVRATAEIRNPNLVCDVGYSGTFDLLHSYAHVYLSSAADVHTMCYLTVKISNPYDPDNPRQFQMVVSFYSRNNMLAGLPYDQPVACISCGTLPLSATNRAHIEATLHLDPANNPVHAMILRGDGWGDTPCNVANADLPVYTLTVPGSVFLSQDRFQPPLPLGEGEDVADYDLRIPLYELQQSIADAFLVMSLEGEEADVNAAGCPW